MFLSDYLNLPLALRQSHIDLSEPCLLHPVRGRVLKMKILRIQHFEIAGIERDLENLSDCHVCHLCSDPLCRSYYHTYLGTCKENFGDRVLQNSYRGEGEWYNNGFFEVKCLNKEKFPRDFVKGRLPKIGSRVSESRNSNKIKNATNGVKNIQVRTALGETLPEGFRWGITVIRSERTCPHCNKTGKGPNMSRYHFDNCPSRVKPDNSKDRYDD